MRTPIRLPLLMLCMASVIIIAPLACMDNRIAEGERLAKQYCASCHVYAGPELLSKRIWMEHVLPEMGLRLGIGDKNTLLTRMPLKLFDQLNSQGIYPNQPVLTEKEWLSILAFYADLAPDTLLIPASSWEINHEKGYFDQTYIRADSGQVAQATMVQFISERKEIWVANRQKKLSKYHLDGNRKAVFPTPSPVVDALELAQPLYLGIGNMLPNEDRNGRLFWLDDAGKKGKLVADSLHRPVQMQQADMNGDGVKDIIILEFGFETGQVRLIDGSSGKAHILSGQPGARSIHLRDANKDGLPYLYILFAQAREQVSLFHNLGKMQFREEVLLKFSSVAGSSHLDMADMNGDGIEDLIVSSGDNADYSMIPKSYHGIDIYTGAADGHFQKAWTYSACGATKTLAIDFDGDGDRDLAMIAFFALKGQSSFLYFENLGGLHFRASDLQVPAVKWLVMDARDMDNDGDQDLILGNFQWGSEETGDQSSRNIEAIILRNTMR